MRNILLVLLLATSSCAAAAGTGHYLVVHTAHAPVKASGCPDKLLDMSEHDTEESAKDAARALRARKDLVDHRTDILPPGRYSIVYRYQSRSALYASDCVFTKTAVMSGDDDQDVKERLALHVRDFQSAFLSQPEVVRTWTGGGLRKVSRDYDGVAVTYLASAGGGRTAVHAQVRNHRTDQKALIRFRVNGVLQPATLELQPGHSANVPLGHDVRHFGAAVQFARPDEKASPSLWRRMQDELREQITVKDGLVETDPACNCVRG